MFMRIRAMAAILPLVGHASASTSVTRLMEYAHAVSIIPVLIYHL